MKRYWIKLYLEIMDDHKMEQMPDKLWRRAVVLFLLAGEYGNDGLLRSEAEVAWRLRITEANLSRSLQTLAAFGIVHETPAGWVVTHFQARQAPSTSTERGRDFRKRNALETKRFKECNENETENQTENQTEVEHSPSASASASVSDSVSDSDSLGDEVQEKGGVASNAAPPGKPFPGAYDLYEANIGVLTPMLADALAADVADYSDEWVCDAIREAVKSNARNLKYVEAILKRWKQDGRGMSKRKKPGTDPQDYVGGKYAEFIVT
ncbi:MAG: hypothetical protein A2X25_06855 [Chloroflexi bacterium GWB2_49_20]|nr:MAG: hypothetical protein A2X25_06855 [Chloroflexi bacterium GWB2_49_20]OGN79087.1 MAG: hypothetical protein A2X26_09205 [Chloroflexi bacterium GWC2_49_37]